MRSLIYFKLVKNPQLLFCQNLYRLKLFKIPSYKFSSTTSECVNGIRPLKIVFFGSDEYSVPHLLAIYNRLRSVTPLNINSNYDHLHVITSSTTTPVYTLSRQLDLDCFVWAKSSKLKGDNNFD